MTVQQNLHTYIIKKQTWSRSRGNIVLAKEGKERKKGKERIENGSRRRKRFLWNRRVVHRSVTEFVVLLPVEVARTHACTLVCVRPENGTRSHFQRGSNNGAASISVFGSRTQCGALTCLYSCTRRATKGRRGRVQRVI